MKTAENIIWLPSYPKSGNTWLRMILLYMIWKDKADPTTVNELIPEMTNTSDLMHFKGVNTVIAKTHLKYGEELRLRDRSIAFIYIVRHPYDVMMSNLNYFFLMSDFYDYDRVKADDTDNPIYKKYKKRFIRSFIEYGGFEHWLKFGHGTIHEHIESWLSQKNILPHILIRYEDLKSNPHSEIKKLAAFLDIKVKDDEIRHIIEKTSFSSMKALEEKDRKNIQQKLFYYQPGYDGGFRFMNKGLVGQWKDELEDHLIKKARNKFKPILNRFGYEG